MRNTIEEWLYLKCLCQALPTEIIQFFGYSRSTVYDNAQKYVDAHKYEEGSANPARQSHERERRLQGPQLSSKELKNSFFEDPVVSLL